MKAEFWHQRWQDGLIGFHQEQVNPYLQQFWPRLGLKGGERVFVPLCGKSKDMLWLREQGHSVFGVELSPMAVEAFFSENQLQAEQRDWAGYPCFEADRISVCCGDFFALKLEHMTTVGVVYDRASLVALPPAMRERYSQMLNTLLTAGTEVFLITMEYPQDEMDGPPFSITDKEVRSLYGKSFELELLDELDVLAQNERFQQQGLTSLLERCYRMTKN